MVERSRSSILRYVSLRITDNITLKRSVVCVWVNNMNIYMILNLRIWKSESIGRLYVIIHICVLLIVILSWIYFNWFMVILRSTTGPYGRSMLEVAYEEILFSLHRGCMGVKLGKSGWGVDMMSPMLDIPGSTPVWARRILFFCFF